MMHIFLKKGNMIHIQKLSCGTVLRILSANTNEQCLGNLYALKQYSLFASQSHRLSCVTKTVDLSVHLLSYLFSHQ